MRIVDILEEERVLPDLKAATRDEALAELVDSLRTSTGVDADRALSLLRQRERAGSTGIGHGIAIPHAKLPGLGGMVACFARSRAGVEFQSLDGKPAHLILALLAPEGNAGLHLKTLARASRLLQDPAFRQKLMDSPDRSALWAAIQQREASMQA